MKLRFGFIVPVLALLIVGCNSSSDGASASAAPKNAEASKPDSGAAAAPAGNTVVGTWTTDNPDMKDATVEFKDDGSLMITGEAPSGDPKVGPIGMEADATYKIDGDKFTMHPTGMKLTAPANADDKMKAAIDAQNAKAPEDVKKQKDQTGTITWKDKDTFTVKSDDPTDKHPLMTFTRKS